MGDNRRLARQIYWRFHSRKSWQCFGCGRSADEVQQVHVHHRDGDRRNHHPGNLVGLCSECHLGDQHDQEPPTASTDPPQPSGLGPPTPGRLGPP